VQGARTTTKQWRRGGISKKARRGRLNGRKNYEKKSDRRKEKGDTHVTEVRRETLSSESQLSIKEGLNSFKEGCNGKYQDPAKTKEGKGEGTQTFCVRLFRGRGKGNHEGRAQGILTLNQKLN